MNRFELSQEDRDFLDLIAADVARRLAEHCGKDGGDENDERFSLMASLLGERVEDMY